MKRIKKKNRQKRNESAKPAFEYNKRNQGSVYFTRVKCRRKGASSITGSYPQSTYMS